MNHVSSKGIPLSPVLQTIANAAIDCGIETKPLALGLRLVGTDVVLSDHWYGAYLCKSATRGLTRFEIDGARCMPSDKGQWRACVERYSTEPGEQRQQASAIVACAVKAGYVALAPVAEKLTVAKPSNVDKGKAPKVDKGKASKLDAALDAIDAK